MIPWNAQTYGGLHQQSTRESFSVQVVYVNTNCVYSPQLLIVRAIASCYVYQFGNIRLSPGYLYMYMKIYM